MRALQVIRLYALAVLAVIVVGGMVLRPGTPKLASRTASPQVVTAGF